MSAAIRRSYIDTSIGQVHLRSTQPAAADRTALICFHQSPQSGRVFTEVLKDLGQDRRAFAPDTPGFGESDLPAEMPEVGDYAAVLAEMIDALQLTRVDILGYHTGAAIGTELALRRPSLVRRLVLIGIPIFTAEEIDAFNKIPWPMPITEDATYVTTEWNRSTKWAGPGQTLAVTFRGFVDKLKAGETAFWGARAVMRYPMAERLAQVTHPIMAIGPRDDLWDISPRCAPLLRNGTFARWPDHGFGIFDAAPDAINQRIRSHLDAP
jgi:pimeloyl-ACP methyl ester carboxylesterase